MHHVDFRVQDDKDKPAVLFPEYGDKEVVQGELEAVGFIQNQTKDGKPGVNMLVKVNETMFVQVGLTADMYLTLAAGMKGAMQRWGEPWEGA